VGIFFAMSLKRLPSPPHNPGVRDLVRGKCEGSRSLTQANIELGFKGWHENGYFPHRDEAGLVQFVTFRLADACPEELRSEWESLLKIEDDRQRRIELEAYLDKGRGACHLRQPEIARLIEDSFRFRHVQDYELRAWVIMPNHVHLLFKVFGVPMSQLLDAWKGFTATQANQVLGRRGKFWQDGYWDTFMRDAEHERRTQKYIEENPLKAGLVVSSAAWQWGSARFRDDYERLCLPD
jgi:REP element-mobilizing transposase RayT